MDLGGGKHNWREAVAWGIGIPLVVIGTMSFLTVGAAAITSARQLLRDRRTGVDDD